MEPDSLYLITNKSAEPELLFRTIDNIEYFIEKTELQLKPIGKIIAINCTPLEVQIILKTNSIVKVRNAQNKFSGSKRSLSQFITQRAKNLFNGYAQAYNKRYNREGALFQKTYKAQLLNEEELSVLIGYYSYQPLAA